MTLTPAQLLRQQALNLDYDDVKELLSSAGLKGNALDALALDWTQKQTNINDIAGSTTTLEGQVEQNTLDIFNNATDIGNNATDIGNNTTNITANTDAIALANGQLVGNNDFAQSLIGGVVLLAANVADASITTTVIATADVGAAPAAYSQAYAQEQTDLINECKSKINSLVSSDVLDLITQLNAFLAANQTANQMSL